MAGTVSLPAVLPLLLVILGHQGLGLEPQREETAATNHPRFEELTTSLAVNQLAILQVMRDGSHASRGVRLEEALRLVHALEAKHLNLRGEVNNAKQEILRLEQAVETGQQRRSQDNLDILKNVINNAKQETLAGMAERDARWEEAAAARDESLQEVMQIVQALQAGQQDLRAMIENATQETLIGVAEKQEVLRQELTNEVTSLRQEMTAQGRLLEEVHRLTACPDGWLRHESSCYLVDGTVRTWEESLAYCRGLGADLAKITSAEEQEFIKGKLERATWIGLNDRATEGRFVWTDGSAPTYTAWIEGEPNDQLGEDCAFMLSGKNYKWNDSSCINNITCVCEQPVHA